MATPPTVSNSQWLPVTSTDQIINSGYAATIQRTQRRRTMGQSASEAHTAQPTWRLGIAAMGFVNGAHCGALERVAAVTAPAPGTWLTLK